MRTKTQTIGVRTGSRVGHSGLVVQGRDPEYDYSFRPRKLIEDQGGEDQLGFSPVTEGNSSGETFSAYPGQTRTKGAKQIVYYDTVLCRRPKKVSKYFRTMEDEKYNSQVAFVKNASKRAQEAFRKLDPDSVVREEAKFSGPGMTQRKGQTEEGE